MRYENRYVQPYHLGCIENLWYLFAFDMDRGGACAPSHCPEFATFGLARRDFGGRQTFQSGDTLNKVSEFSLHQRKPNIQSGIISRSAAFVSTHTTKAR
jgi:hypothetical protein